MVGQRVFTNSFDPNIYITSDKNEIQYELSSIKVIEIESKYRSSIVDNRILDIFLL